MFSCLSYLSCCKRSKPETTNPAFSNNRKARELPVQPAEQSEKYKCNTIVAYDPQICKAVEHITWKTASPYIPPVTQGKVIKVYDGDTITIATLLPNCETVYRFSVRLLGIDSAEMKGGSFAEKESAIRARDALATKVLGKMVLLKNVSLEKYGRILANVYCNDIHINQWMLDEGLAVAYDGGTKYKSDEFVEHW